MFILSPASQPAVLNMYSFAHILCTEGRGREGEAGSPLIIQLEEQKANKFRIFTKTFEEPQQIKLIAEMRQILTENQQIVWCLFWGGRRKWPVIKRKISCEVRHNFPQIKLKRNQNLKEILQFNKFSPQAIARPPCLEKGCKGQTDPFSIWCPLGHPASQNRTVYCSRRRRRRHATLGVRLHSINFPFSLTKHTYSHTEQAITTLVRSKKFPPPSTGQTVSFPTIFLNPGNRRKMNENLEQTQTLTWWENKLKWQTGGEKEARGNEGPNGRIKQGSDRSG